MRRVSALATGLLLVGCAVAFGAPGHAIPDDPHDDYNRVKTQLSQAGNALDGATARAADATARYQAASSALPAALERAADAHGAVIAAQSQSATADRAAAQAAQELAQAEKSYGAAVDQVTVERDRLGDIAAAAYQGSALAELNSLLDARGPQDVASRLGYLQRIAENQRDTIEQTVAARHAAKLAENDASLARDRAEAAKAEAARRVEATRAAESEVQAAADDVARLVAERKAAADAADAERAETLARYEELKQESDRVAARLREWEAAQKPKPNAPAKGPVMRPGARLLTPVRGAWKSSDFGMRYDPYYHVWQLHAGTDLAAPGGTPIYAAADGVVAYAGWMGGYGNYTCIRHGVYQGKGLSTCYGHQSRILVDVGQHVRRGQLIGRVGTTGASTGDHLHFEVRLNGNPVNPISWLPSCLC